MVTGSKNNYDVIIIGSGMGALTTASILSQLKGLKVLVLERHFKIGGFTHIFKRKENFKWDVGLHYVGQMAKGSNLRNLFDYITRGGVDWHKMPDIYDKFVYPDFTFPSRIGVDALKEDLASMFPSEGKAIKRYFDDVRKAMRWYGRFNILGNIGRRGNIFSSALNSLGSELASSTTGAYLNKNFSDPKLKAVVASQWGDCGLPPSMSSFLIHAVITAHYFEGGYYPIGGSKTIADSIKPIIEATGGKISVNSKVKEIILEHNKAIGVAVEEGKDGNLNYKEYYAPHIISNAGAYITFTELLPSYSSKDFVGEIRNFPKGTGTITLYLGFNENPAKLGFRGENHWIYSGYDHDEIFAKRNNITRGEVNAVYLSFPSLKDPLSKGHTAEVITFADYEPFSKWADEPWKNRSEEYQEIKSNISKSLIDFVDGLYPGFMDIIDYSELSTPLSTEYFTGFRGGEIYGIPAVPERYKANWLGPKTPVENLYLTGTDTTAGHGIAGAMMGGVLAAGSIIGMPGGIIKIFKEAGKFGGTS